eukprot:6212414-Pleurochrysis_carterae.AAC.6
MVEASGTASLRGERGEAPPEAGSCKGASSTLFGVAGTCSSSTYHADADADADAPAPLPLLGAGRHAAAYKLECIRLRQKIDSI